MTRKCVIAAAAVLVGPLSSLRAAAPDAGELQQSVTSQEQIRGEAQQLVSRLDEVLAEYDRNGLAKGDDYRNLLQRASAPRWAP